MCCCCSVTKSCSTLANPWTAARQASLFFTISRSLLKLMSIESVMSSNHLILCRPLLLLPSIFPSSLPFASGGQNTGASALASVLPMNIQGWFPLGLIGLMCLLAKGLSRVFSSTIIKSLNSLELSLLYAPTFISVPDYWENHSFDYRDLCRHSDVFAF